MARINFFGLLCIVAMFGISCTQGNPEHLEAVAKLEMQLDTVDALLQPVNIEKVTEYRDVAKKSLKFIQRNYLDTMPLDLGLFLSDYRADRKLLDWSISHYTKCSEELSNSKVQLKQLRHDVEHELLSDEEFKGFLASEKAIVQSLRDDAYDLSGKWEKAITRYEERNPRVQGLVEELGG